LQHAERDASQFGLWTEASVASWLLHALYNLSWAKGTLKNRLAAAAWYKQVILQQPWVDGPGSFVHLMKRAIDRLGSDAAPKQAIKADRLGEVMRLLDAAQGDAGLRHELAQLCPLWRTNAAMARAECAAWFAVSFACFFRASETASLQWADIAATIEDGRVFAMRVSLSTSRFAVRKTSGTTVHLDLAAMTSSAPLFRTSAVARLSKLISLKRARLDGAVFSISVEQARKVLQCLAGKVFGKPARSFGLHSLRSGAACSADEDGQGLARIMFMGRWKSAAVLAYLRADADGASALLLRAQRPGQGTAAGETRLMGAS
jgi:integrase